MKDFDLRWQQLVAAARQAPGPGPVAAPYGFATRVVSRALGDDRPGLLAAFGRFSVRALWVAGVLMLVSVAASYFSSTLGAADTNQLQFDPVSEVLSSASS
jgi:hypothetical protein